MANGPRKRVSRAPKADADEVEAEAEEVNGVSSALKKASLDLGTTSASTIVVHVVTLFVFSCAASWNTLDGGWVFDDMPAIVDNADCHSTRTDTTGLWKNNFWGQQMGDPRSQHLSYRPLTTMTFRFNYAISELEPWGFHMFNIVANAVATVLFYFVCRRLHGFDETPAVVSLFGAAIFAVHPVHVEAVANVVGRSEILSAICFFAAFLLYCLAAERSIVFLPLAIAATLAAMLCKEQGIMVVAVCIAWDLLYNNGLDISELFSPRSHSLSWIDEDEVKGDLCQKLFKAHCKKGTQLITRDRLHRLSEIPKFVDREDRDELVKFQAKLKDLPAEIAYEPFEMELMRNFPELLVHIMSTKSAREVTDDAELWNQKTSVDFTDEEALAAQLRGEMVSAFRMLVYLFSVMYCFRERMKLNLDDEVKVDEKTNPANHIADFELRVLTKLHYTVLHSWLLVYPFELCCDWSSFGIANIDSLEDSRNLVSLAWICVMFFLISRVWMPRSSQQARAKLGMAFVLTFLPFLPASGLFLEVGFVVAERVMYTPAAGACFYISLYIWRRWRYFDHRGSQMARTIDKELRDDFTKANADPSHKRNPNLTRLVHDMEKAGVWTAKNAMLFLAAVVLLAFTAMTLRRNIEWKSERTLYESGIKMMPNNAKLHHNYAHSLTSDPAMKHAAEFHYREAIRIYPPYGSAYINLGVQYANGGRLEDAVTTWREGLTQWNKRPILGNDPVVLAGNLGTALANLGRPREAEPYLKDCLRRDPRNSRCASKLREVEGR